MVVLKLHHQLFNEKGYLLLESLVALMVISTILITIYPLAVKWIVLHESRSEKVEISRVLYEQSIDWPTQSLAESNFEVKKTKNKLSVISPKQDIGIEIYEANFE